MELISRIVCRIKGHTLENKSITKTIGENNWCKRCTRCGKYVLHCDIGGVVISEKDALDFKREWEENQKLIEKAMQTSAE
mgnify:CR=1 FL=1